MDILQENTKSADNSRAKGKRKGGASSLQKIIPTRVWRRCLHSSTISTRSMFMESRFWIHEAA
jgi:hypothetical protein